jgi:hypothetical protein
MGYDVNMVVVEKSKFPTREIKKSTKPYDDGSGFEDELDTKGKPVYTGRQTYYCGHTSKLAARTKADDELAKQSSCYFFPPCGDGNHEVMIDQYEETIRERSIDDVIEALENDIKLEPRPYRRLPPALAALKAIREHWGNTDQLRVLFYAH